MNLFDEGASHVRPDRKRLDYLVTPDSSPSTHYEIIRITDVFAHYTGRQTRARVQPFRRAQFRNLGRLSKSYVEHDRVMVAILRGQRAAATDAMRAHILTVREEYEAYIQSL